MLTVIAKVINDGNRSCNFEICFEADNNKADKKVIIGSLTPNNEEKFVFKTIATLDLTSVLCTLSYLSYHDINKELEKKEEKKKLIHVIVERRKDKVEIDLGALDLFSDDE